MPESTSGSWRGCLCWFTSPTICYPLHSVGQEVQASLSISTLALGAICFVLSNVVVHESRRVTLGFYEAYKKAARAVRRKRGVRRSARGNA